MPTTAAAYERALAASPDLHALDRTVRLLCALAPKATPFCAGCLWQDILKPLASPLVGWERNTPLEAHEPGDGPLILTGADILALPVPRFPAETQTEEWLRTSEAWDAVTDEWLRMLDAADPAKGHGYPSMAEAVAR